MVAGTAGSHFAKSIAGVAESAKSNLIAVSVCTYGDAKYLGLRFRLFDEHVKFFKGADRILVRGQPANGFTLAADKKGLKLNRCGLTSGAYLTSSLSSYDLSKRTRKRIDIRPEFESGHIRIPPLPKAWIDGEAEFDPVVGEGNREVSLSRHPTDTDLVIASTTVPLNGYGHNGHGNGAAIVRASTVPLPKQGVAYQVPDNISEMQADLAVKLADARAIIARMETLSGMKFALDRNLRLVVSLPVDLRSR